LRLFALQQNIFLYLMIIADSFTRANVFIKAVRKHFLLKRA